MGTFVLQAVISLYLCHRLTENFTSSVSSHASVGVASSVSRQCAILSLSVVAAELVNRPSPYDNFVFPTGVFSVDVVADFDEDISAWDTSNVVMMNSSFFGNTA